MLTAASPLSTHLPSAADTRLSLGTPTRHQLPPTPRKGTGLTSEALEMSSRKKISLLE